VRRVGCNAWAMLRGMPPQLAVEVLL